MAKTATAAPAAAPTATKGRPNQGRPNQGNDRRIHLCLSPGDCDLLEQIRAADYMPSISAALRALILREAQRRNLTARPQEVPGQ